MKHTAPQIGGRLSDVAVIRAGFAFRTRLDHDPAGTLAVLQLRNIDNAGHVDVREALRIDPPAKAERHLLKDLDLLLRPRGEGSLASVLRDVRTPMIAAAPLIVIRPRPGKVDPVYLCWLLGQPQTQIGLARSATGASVRMISRSVLADFPVSLPPLAEQKRIGQIATLADREEELSQRLVAKRRQWLDAVLTRHLRNSSLEAEAGM